MLQITVSNQIRIRGASVPLRSAITKALEIDNPVYIDKQKKRQKTWGIERKLKLYQNEGPDLICPRGFLEDLEKILRQHEIDPLVTVMEHYNEVKSVDFGEWNAAYSLKDDQVPAVEAMLTKNGVTVAPAGAGKTVMAMRYIWERKQPTLFIAHTKELIDQAAEKAQATMSDVGTVGVIGAGKVVWGSGKLIVATVQTLAANPQLIETLNSVVGLVVIDEMHRYVMPMFLSVVSKFSSRYIAGITATPERKDRLQAYMYRAIGPEVYRITRDGLYESGRLIKPEIKFVYTDFSYEPASIRNGTAVDAGGEELDYHDLIQHLISDDDRATLVANTVLDNLQQGFTIVISESIRYAHKLHGLLLERAVERGFKGIRTAVVHGPISQCSWRVARSEFAAQELMQQGKAIAYRFGKSGKWEIKVENYTEREMKSWQCTPVYRKRVMEDSRAGKLDILIASSIAKEGLDLPNLCVGILAIPQRGDSGDAKNGIGVEQTLGRIQRPDPRNPDKKALWIDIVDSNVGVFKSQYYSRRKVYQRLGLTVPKKPKTTRDDIEAFLDGMSWD